MLGFHIAQTQFPLFLKSYISMLYLLPLMKLHWYIIINQSLHFIQIFLVLSYFPLSVTGSHPGYHILFSCQFLDSCRMWSFVDFPCFPCSCLFYGYVPQILVTLIPEELLSLQLLLFWCIRQCEWGEARPQSLTAPMLSGRWALQRSLGTWQELNTLHSAQQLFSHIFFPSVPQRGSRRPFFWGGHSLTVIVWKVKAGEISWFSPVSVSFSRA